MRSICLVCLLQQWFSAVATLTSSYRTRITRDDQRRREKLDPKLNGLSIQIKTVWWPSSAGLQAANQLPSQVSCYLSFAMPISETLLLWPKTFLFCGGSICKSSNIIPQVQETISGLADHFKKNGFLRTSKNQLKISIKDMDTQSFCLQDIRPQLVLSYMDKSTNQWQKYPSLVTRKSYCW